MLQEMYSVDQVAAQLGLHVRTVRSYVRDGRLKAVRIGKQYRIAREDLDALTGQAAAGPNGSVGPEPVDVSSVVQIDQIGPDAASRMSSTLMAATAGGRDGGTRVHLETVYDQDRARLKIIVLADLATSADLLRLIGAVVGS